MPPPVRSPCPAPPPSRPDRAPFALPDSSSMLAKSGRACHNRPLVIHHRGTGMKNPDTSKGNGAGSNSADLKKFYSDMLLIRRFEEKAGQLYGMGLIGGFCHLYIGQEAVVVGMQAA